MCSEVPGFSEASLDLLVLPFFEEDISDVFEIKTNVKIKRHQEKFSWKRRKRYSRKYKILHFKQRQETSTLIAVQKTDVVLKISDEVHQEDLDCRSSEAQSMLSEEHLQIEDLKPPIYENVALIVEQAHLEAGCNITEHNLDKRVENKDERKSGPIQETETFVKRKEGSQGSEDAEKLQHTCTTIFDLPQQTEVKDLEEKNKETIVKEQILPELQSSEDKRRTRPNYFVAVPIVNDKILDLIEDVQENIVLKEPKLLRALIPAEKVHLTILVAHLQSEDDIRRAVSALMESKKKIEELLQGEQLGLPLDGIGQFNNQVIYIKITEQKQEILSQIAEAVTQCFTDGGVDITGTKDFKPHLTFLKLSKVPSLRRKGFRKICSDLYKEYEECSFGIEMFSRLDLCSMHKKNKLSGYYYCESSIFLNTIQPQELKGSVTEIKEDSNEPVSVVESCVDCSSASCLAKHVDKIILDITDAVTISKEEIKETNGQPEASHANLEEKSCSTPDPFPTELIASTAVDDRPEKEN